MKDKTTIDVMDTTNTIYNFNATGMLQQVLKPLRKLQEDTTLEKIMPDGKVFEPIKVFEEGEYVTSSRNGKLVKFKATKERMEKWVKNAYRDVPFNLDHQKESISEIGWLRAASSKTYVDVDPATGKHALYTQPEFTQAAYDNFIARGRYRDFSLEIDPDSECITGIALTNYPRLKTLTQMSELADLDNPHTEVPTVAVVEEETTTETVEQPLESTKEETTMTDEMKAQLELELKEKLEAELKAEYDAKFSSIQAELETMRKAKEVEEANAKRAALVLEMSKKVDKLILSDDGKSILPAGIKDKAVELFCHIADADEVVMFSTTADGEQEEVKVSATDLLLEILEAQAKFSTVMQDSPLSNGTRIDPNLDEDTRPGVSEALRKIYQRQVVQ